MTKVLIEGYDHFCPWSGTVIGKKNMLWFQLWVSTLVLALVLDFILLSGFLAGSARAWEGGACVSTLWTTAHLHPGPSVLIRA